MKAIHSYKQYNKKFIGLELLTQLLSVIKWKLMNPNIPFYLYTDTDTLQQYKYFKLDQIYDFVDTDVLDTLPKEQINYKTFWATPKLWVMKHQTDRFCMLDTDLVWHKTIDNFFNYDIAFLHTESPYIYPKPYHLSTPDNFKWSKKELDAFSSTVPINCAFTVWNNLNLLKKYIDRYFEFVTDNKGIYNIPKKYLSRDFIESGAQIVIEQWWLSVLLELNPKYTSHSILNIIAFSSNFKSQLYNNSVENAINELDSSLFHLWGGKRYLNKKDIKYYIQIFDDLKDALNYYIPKLDNYVLNESMDLICNYCNNEIDNICLTKNGYISTNI